MRLGVGVGGGGGGGGESHTVPGAADSPAASRGGARLVYKLLRSGPATARALGAGSVPAVRSSMVVYR